MATLDYQQYPDHPDLTTTQLSIQDLETSTVDYDYQHQPKQDLNTPTNEELDRELEDLLNLMDTSEDELGNEELLDPTATAVDVEWLDPTDLCSESAQFDYQREKTGSSYSYQSTTHNSRFDYEVDRCNSRDLTVGLSTNNYTYEVDQASDKFDYSSTHDHNSNYQTDHGSSSRGYDYKPTTQSSSGNYSVDPSSSNFDYAPTSTGNDRSSYDYQPSNSFDYKPTPTPTPSSNHYPSTDYSEGSSDQAILDVEVDNNTRIRLEVGASASIDSGSIRASAYAKATVYRRK